MVLTQALDESFRLLGATKIAQHESVLLDRVLAVHIERVVRACGGRKPLAARILGVHVRTLQRRIHVSSGRPTESIRQNGNRGIGVKSQVDGARVLELRAENKSWKTIAARLHCTPQDAKQAAKRAGTKERKPIDGARVLALRARGLPWKNVALKMGHPNRSGLVQAALRQPGARLIIKKRGKTPRKTS